MSGIRALAADAAGRYFAAAAFSRTVAVWSVEERRRIARFDTCFEFGGERIAVLGGETPQVVVAAYDRYGVEAYSLSGQRLWCRPDLERVQSVSELALPSLGPVIGVGLEGTSFVVLSPDSGRTLDRFRGVHAVHTDDRGGCSVRVHSGRVVLVSPAGSHSVPLESFGVLDAAASPEAVLVSEAAGPIRCLGLDGAERWRWTAGRGIHALSVAWEPSDGSWQAVVWPFENGGEKMCVTLSATGSELSRRRLGEPTAHAFSRGGGLLITSERVYRTRPWQELWAIEGAFGAVEGVEAEEPPNG